MILFLFFTLWYPVIAASTLKIAYLSVGIFPIPHLISISCIGFGGRHIGNNVSNSNIIHAGRFLAPTFSHPEKNYVAGIYHQQAVYFYVFYKATVHRFQRDSGSVGVENFVVDDSYILKTAAGYGAELYGIGTGADDIVSYKNIIAEKFRVMRFQTDAIIRRIDIGIGYRYAVAIYNVDTVFIPVGFVVYSDAVYL